MPKGIYDHRVKLDILGYENNILVIEEYLYSEKKTSYWRVKAKYNNEYHILTRKLLLECDFRPSCCIDQTERKISSAFTSVYHQYKAGATKRGYSFNLTKDQLRKLTSSDCYYCKKPPSNKQRQFNGSGGEYIYNGVDRMDNNKGYSLENCLPCCSICNHAKHNLTYDQFVEMVVRIFQTLNLKGYNYGNS